MSLEEKMDELELGVSGKMRKGGMRQSELNLSTLAQPGAQQLVGFGMLPDQVRDSYRNILSISSGLHVLLHSRKGKSILPEDVY